MVNAIKRWLGIDVLERENLQLAKALKAAHRRIGETDKRINEAQKRFDAAILLLQASKQSLTSEPAKPKLVATAPKAVSWKEFRSAAERATEPEREEA